MLNINADTAAGAIAEALKARRLVFLTDVPGVRSGTGEVLSRVTADEAHTLIESGVIEGGMIPKVEACLAAVSAGCISLIADGRQEHTLLAVCEGQAVGTIVG
jgi:acetylglutamate kinase